MASLAVHQNPIYFFIMMPLSPLGEWAPLLHWDTFFGGVLFYCTHQEKDYYISASSTLLLHAIVILARLLVLLRSIRS